MKNSLNPPKSGGFRIETTSMSNLNVAILTSKQIEPSNLIDAPRSTIKLIAEISNEIQSIDQHILPTNDFICILAIKNIDDS